MLERLKREVFEANLRLRDAGLVTLTWGNASGLAADGSCFVIKPSGVPYELLSPADMVVVDLEGAVVEGDARPSSDTPTHLELYRGLSGVGGIVHTHSTTATAFAQARREIPCLGTTHADHFNGPVPVTRVLSSDEVADAYEANTGRVIVECLAGLAPLTVPAALVPGHGPFTWGASVAQAADNAIALEAVATMAMQTLSLRPEARELELWVMDRHHRRKHGADAYYGQPDDD